MRDALHHPQDLELDLVRPEPLVDALHGLERLHRDQVPVVLVRVGRGLRVIALLGDQEFSDLPVPPSGDVVPAVRVLVVERRALLCEVLARSDVREDRNLLALQEAHELGVLDLHGGPEAQLGAHLAIPLDVVRVDRGVRVDGHRVDLPDVRVLWPGVRLHDLCRCHGSQLVPDLFDGDRGVGSPLFLGRRLLASEHFTSFQ